MINSTVNNLAALKAEIETALPGFLPRQSTIAQPIVDAMHHAVLGGGKRLRPMLACAAAQASGGKLAQGMTAGCAVEFIHAYSLIHDDLPAMDDDDLRHGLPSTHVAFGEANAILAGDSLHSLAFQTIAEDQSLDPVTQIEMMRVLSQAAGWAGMAGGQCLDIESEGKTLNLDQLKTLHAAKTGALIRVAVQLGCLSTGQTQAHSDIYSALSCFGDLIGLAFQVMDDVLDVTQTTEQLGKPAGSDEGLGKNTFPKLMGLNEATTFAHDLIEKARSQLRQASLETDLLVELTDLVINRDH